MLSRESELLPVPYFHVVFTIPEAFHRLFRRHQERLYPAAMRAASETLLELGSSAAPLGGRVGVLASLHTWSRKLLYHPHVHCLVTAGAFDADGVWHPASGSRITSERTLITRFRRNLRKRMRMAVAQLVVPKSRADSWQVYIEQPQHGTSAILRYLAKSLYCGPISDGQVTSVTSSEVSFVYRARDDGKRRKLVLKGEEFLRRFLQHVWPKHIHKVQYHGLWSRRSRGDVAELKARLADHGASDSPAVVALSTSSSAPSLMAPSWLKCPTCGGTCTAKIRFKRGTLPPPLRTPTPLHDSPMTTGPP